MSKATYLVLEIGTGLVDGYYFGREAVEGMCTHWNELRPEHKHLTVEIVEGDGGRLPDHQMMNEYCPATGGGRCICSQHTTTDAAA